jgi:hypothetical protein
MEDFNRHYDSLMKDINNLYENLRDIVRRIDTSTQSK